MIDYRKHRWLIFGALIGWFAWLTLMSKIGLVGLDAIGENPWLRLLWIFSWGTITFGLPFLAIRFAGRRKKSVDEASK